MSDWLWWALAAYLGIGVLLGEVIVRALRQEVGATCRLGIAVGWLPLAAWEVAHD